MSLTEDQMAAIGFASVGRGVVIDETAKFFGAEHIHLGDYVRIDCFVVMTAGPGEVRFGRNVHLGAAAQVFGAAGVVIEDFGGLSGRVSIYSSSDDYVGGHLTNPTVPARFRQVTARPVHLGRHALVGAGSVILPGVTLGFGAAVGALTTVRRDVPECAVVAGNPVRRVGERNGQRLRALEADYLASSGDGRSPDSEADATLSGQP